ncbi:MAG: oxidoreductase [Stenotrophobium sp.]
MAQRWTTQDMPSLKGRIAVVTGANRGLGLEISCGLAGAGATVVMACRDAARARDAAQAVRQRIADARIETMSLDLADLDSIRAFAPAFEQKFPRLDLLCNNASAIMVPKQQTRQGFEMHIGVNHLGSFALTGTLLPRLRASAGARIVNTASIAHGLNQGLDLEDLHFARTPYKEMEAYGRSKLATLLFTFELDRRLRALGIGVRAAAAHPGYASTNPDLGGFFMRLSTRLFAQSATMGALPALYAATAPDVQGGEYFGPGGFKQLRGTPARVECRADARDPALAARLWTLSEQLTGVHYLDQTPA